MGDKGITKQQCLVAGGYKSSLPEQDPETITMADIQEKVSGVKSWAAPGTQTKW